MNSPVPTVMLAHMARPCPSRDEAHFTDANSRWDICPTDLDSYHFNYPLNDQIQTLMKFPTSMSVCRCHFETVLMSENLTGETRFELESYGTSRTPQRRVLKGH